MASISKDMQTINQNKLGENDLMEGLNKIEDLELIENYILDNFNTEKNDKMDSIHGQNVNIDENRKEEYENVEEEDKKEEEEEEEEEEGEEEDEQNINSDNDSVDNNAESRLLDYTRLHAIEVPARVLNPGKVIDMLGGNSVLKQKLLSVDSELELNLRPKDRYAHPICSRTDTTKNILLKVSIPKKILNEYNGDKMKALRNSNGKYKVLNYYLIQDTRRFRELADFQYNIKNSQFINQIQNVLIRGNFDELSNLHIRKNVAPIAGNFDLIPPPRFSKNYLPLNYDYLQNPYLVKVMDGSEGKLVNKTPRHKMNSQILSWGDKVPSGPLKLENPSEPIQGCINLLKDLFAKRGIWTRNGVMYHATPDLHEKIKLAIPYVAYSWRSGPWRGTYAAYGVDPCSSNKYAIYQTDSHRIPFKYQMNNKRSKSKNSSLNNNETSENNLDSNDSNSNENIDEGSEIPPFIFDGKHLTKGKVFQFCDITDPGLKEYLKNPVYREKPDQYDGWYEHEYIFKLRKYLKVKINGLYIGKETDSETLKKILEGDTQVGNEEEGFNKEDVNMDEPGGESIERSERSKAAIQHLQADTKDNSSRLNELLEILQPEFPNTTNGSNSDIENDDFDDEIDEYELLE